MTHAAPRAERIGNLSDVGAVGRYGLAHGVELVAAPGTGERIPTGQRLGTRIRPAARRRGELLSPLGETIVAMPPFTFQPAELTLVFDMRAGTIEETVG